MGCLVRSLPANPHSREESRLTLSSRRHPRVRKLPRSAFAGKDDGGLGVDGHRAILLHHHKLAISLVISFVYWVIMFLGVSMAHAGILHPVIGAWAGNILFCLLGIGFIYYSRT